MAERLAAFGAFVGLVARVDALVLHQRRVLAEGLAAFLARVGPLACMDAPVHREVRIVVEGLPAVRTLVGLVGRLAARQLRLRNRTRHSGSLAAVEPVARLWSRGARLLTCGVRAPPQARTPRFRHTRRLHPGDLWEPTEALPKSETSVLNWDFLELPPMTLVLLAATMTPSWGARQRRRPAPASAAVGALGEPHQGGRAEAPASSRRGGSHRPRGSRRTGGQPQPTRSCLPSTLRRFALTQGPWRKEKKLLRGPYGVLLTPTLS